MEPSGKFNGFVEPFFDLAGGITDEKFAYVGCVHGGDDRLIQQLEDLAAHPPNYLIFTGDIAGSPEMEELKRRFYNLVYNRAKPLLTHNPDVGDDELVTYSEEHGAPAKARTLRDGYIALFEYQKRLEGLPESMVAQQCRALTNSEIASQIRHIVSFPFYGNWVASLSSSVRRSVLDTLETSAERLIAPIQKLRENQTQVVVIGGNWDGKTSGLSVIAGQDVAPFNTAKFLRKHGVPLLEQAQTLETSSTLHVLLPFDSLLDGVNERQLDDFAIRVAQARNQGKAVIMVGHGEANWKIHTLPISVRVPNPPERNRYIANFGRIMRALSPDQVLYSHQHSRILDEMRQEIGLNAKYILEGLGDGVSLVEDFGQIGARPNQILATYVPLRHIAKGIFSTMRDQSVFAGTQRPIEVKSR